MANPVATALVRIVLFYLAVCAALYYFLRWYHPPDPINDSTAWTAALIALPLAAGLGYLVGARPYLKEERLIRAAWRPVLKDGERAIVVGPIEALAEPLKSPLGGTACVAYAYAIDHEGTHADSNPIRVRDYWGTALSPCAVQTREGPVHILGYPSLELSADVLEGEEAYRAAEAYVRSTHFERYGGFGERLDQIGGPLGEVSDTFVEDFCTERAQERKLSELQLNERCVRVGQEVCAAGYYDAAKRGLVARGMKGVRLTTASPELWASENRGWFRTYVGWGTGLTLLAIAAALATRWC